MRYKTRSLISWFRQRFLYKRPRWNSIIRLINSEKMTTYAEVGVWEGEMAKQIIENCHTLKKIILIGPYNAILGYLHGKIYKKGMQDRVDKAKEIMLKRTDSPKVKRIFKQSVNDASNLMDESIDLVFIDAQHAYEYVKQDLDAWFPKIKKGGIIAGHDYNFRWREHVMKALNERFSHDKIMLEDDAVWRARI